MALRYYDEAIVNKFQRWIKSNSLHILKPDETERLFNLESDKNKDKPINLPLITLSRDTSFEILRTIKNKMSYSGYPVGKSEDKSTTLPLNAIPVTTTYQLDIYTKTYEESDEYLRNFIINIINHPKITILIPYNGTNIKHVANIQILGTVTDNSDVPLRLYTGQFTRWTIQFQLLDAYLFSIPFTKNWIVDCSDLEIIDSGRDIAEESVNINPELELDSTSIDDVEDSEIVDIKD